MHPLLVLRVGYMEKYDGVGTITSGGAYIRQNGIGGEIFNFKPNRGKCFGYAMSRNYAGINLRSIQNGSWSVGDELAGVDVIFIARRRGYGQVVVGTEGPLCSTNNIEQGVDRFQRLKGPMASIYA